MKYISKRNWSDELYEKLNILIENQIKLRLSNKIEDNFVCFDFDDTTSIGNTQENVLMFMINTLEFRLTPNELMYILCSATPSNSRISTINQNKLTFKDLCLDIVENYEWLYHNYIKTHDKNASTLNIIKQSVQFNDFRTKLWFFYKNRKSLKQKRAKGNIWPVYWFAGYTEHELISFSKKALREMSKLPIENIIFKSSNGGKTGFIEETFRAGISFPKEMLDIYQVFMDNNISVFVISASPYEIVVGAIEEFGFNVPKRNIFGMKISRNDMNLLTARIDSKSIISSGKGKHMIITDKIIPLYNKEPLAVFGDSMGDFEMLTKFSHATLKVLLNRVFNDATKDLIINARGNQNNFYVQGRDENIGELRPSNKSILFGSEQEVLTIDELV